MMQRIRFQFDDGDVVIDFMLADLATNCIFRASYMAHIQPYEWATRLGRVSDQRNLELLAKVYAEGVITGSPEGEYQDYTVADWEKWLLEHPNQLMTLYEKAQPNAVAAAGQQAESGGSTP